MDYYWPITGPLLAHYWPSTSKTSTGKQTLGDFSDPTPVTNMVAEPRWANGHMVGPIKIGICRNVCHGGIPPKYRTMACDNLSILRKDVAHDLLDFVSHHRPCVILDDRADRRSALLIH